MTAPGLEKVETFRIVAFDFDAERNLARAHQQASAAVKFEEDRQETRTILGGKSAGLVKGLGEILFALQALSAVSHDLFACSLMHFDRFSHNFSFVRFRQI